MKNPKQAILKNEFGWETSNQLSDQVINILFETAIAIRNWLEIPEINSAMPTQTFLRNIGAISWQPSNFLWRRARFHHVEFQNIYIDPLAINLDTAVHEMAHVLDNSLGSHAMATFFGGGPADDLLRCIGANPDLFFPRFLSKGYEKHLRSCGLELNPTTYGRSCGPAEDFAESFRLAVLHPQLLKSTAPIRSEWFQKWRRDF